MKIYLVLLLTFLTTNAFANYSAECFGIKGLSIAVKTSKLLPKKTQISREESLAMSNMRNTHIAAILNSPKFKEIESLLTLRAERAMFRQFKKLYRAAIDTRSCTGKSLSGCVDDLNRQTKDMNLAVESIASLEDVVCDYL